MADQQQKTGTGSSIDDLDMSWPELGKIYDRYLPNLRQVLIGFVPDLKAGRTPDINQLTTVFEHVGATANAGRGMRSGGTVGG